MLSVQDVLLWITAVSAILYATFRYKRRRLYKFADKLPGPNGFPLLGVIPEFIGLKSEDVSDYLQEKYDRFSESFRVWLGPFLFYIVKDVDDLEIILKSEITATKHAIYDRISLPHGLFTINGDDYKLHRKLITPAFNLKSLQSYVKIISDQSMMFCDKLMEELEGKEFDISERVSHYNLKNSLATMFARSDIPEKMIETYHNDNLTMGDVINERMVKYWLTFDSIFKLSSLYKIAKKHRYERPNTLSDYLMRDNEENFKIGNHKDALGSRLITDLLYQMRDKMTYGDIKGEIDTILIAGYEATAITLSNILLMLAIHQDVQAKCVEEIREIFSSEDEDVTEESMAKMEYLETVIKECLRLFPIPGISVRVATKDTQLTKHLVPAGTSILYETLFFQTAKTFWGPDAKEFNPDRFRPENICNVHRYAFIPFTEGSRKCIGHKYAWLMMKIFTANVLRKFHLSSSVKFEDISLHIDFLIRIRPGYFVKFEERTDL